MLHSYTVRIYNGTHTYIYSTYAYDEEEAAKKANLNYKYGDRQDVTKIEYIKVTKNF